MCGLKTLFSRRQDRCLQFSLKCIKHEDNKKIFPTNPNIENSTGIRIREQFKVNFGKTNSKLTNSAAAKHPLQREGPRDGGTFKGVRGRSRRKNKL